MKRILTVFFRVIICLCCIVTLGTAIYLNDYYHADFEGEFSPHHVNMNKVKDGIFLDGPSTENALIFYPGAKVEYTAYLPMLCKVAEEFMDVFIIKMPGNLAILGMNKADEILKNYDGYSQWFMGGHSLGGAMAAAYTASHEKEIDGLLLLAAYPTKKLPNDSLKVLSIYGSEDGVLNMEKIKDGRQFMPDDYTEICLEGGNHAQFGNYGMQDGDGTAEISRKTQQEETIQELKKFIENTEK